MATFEQQSPDRRVTVVVGVPVDSHTVGAINNVGSTIDVHYDSHWEPATRQRALAEAEIMFGIPAGTPAQLK